MIPTSIDIERYFDEATSLETDKTREQLEFDFSIKPSNEIIKKFLRKAYAKCYGILFVLGVTIKDLADDVLKRNL